MKVEKKVTLHKIYYTSCSSGYQKKSLNSFLHSSSSNYKFQIFWFLFSNPAISDFCSQWSLITFPSHLYIETVFLLCCECRTNWIFKSEFKNSWEIFPGAYWKWVIFVILVIFLHHLCTIEKKKHTSSTKLLW